MASEIHVRDGGVWRKAKEIHVKDGGTWRKCKEVYVKSGDVWRKVFSSLTNVMVAAEDPLYPGTFGFHAFWRFDSGAYGTLTPETMLTSRCTSFYHTNGSGGWLRLTLTDVGPYTSGYFTSVRIVCAAQSLDITLLASNATFNDVGGVDGYWTWTGVGTVFVDGNTYDITIT